MVFRSFAVLARITAEMKIKYKKHNFTYWIRNDVRSVLSSFVIGQRIGQRNFRGC